MLVYMQVSGISGSGGGARPGWIWLDKCTFGFERSAETEIDDDSPTAPKKPELDPVIIEKPADASSAALMRWIEQGDPRSVTLEFCVNVKTVVMRCTLEQARLLTYHADASGGRNARVKDVLSLNYKSIDIEYKQYGVDNVGSTAQTQFSYDSEAT